MESVEAESKHTFIEARQTPVEGICISREFTPKSTEIISTLEGLLKKTPK